MFPLKKQKAAIFTTATDCRPGIPNPFVTIYIGLNDFDVKKIFRKSSHSHKMQEPPRGRSEISFYTVADEAMSLKIRMTPSRLPGRERPLVTYHRRGTFHAKDYGIQNNM
ncbi:MAG: hypothetical protein A2511_17920 [Deltaproteobacteria bacterium RIFOXYD12_FULL_50_9]|nr:MAG: hypothetical protein A2511_17920 [Deltaproteobacteria bacterium RIFOXYD12_FULL_50_9]